MEINPQASFDFGQVEEAANDPVYRAIFPRDRNPLYLTPEYKRALRLALERSHYKCERCGGRTRLRPHHVIPTAIRPDLFLSLDNLQVLCKACHENATMQYAAQHGWRYQFG